MVYDRYAGIKSLPGPDGKMPRPFRVDEDGNVIYLDEERAAAQRGGWQEPNEQSRAGILSWEELDRKREQELEAIRYLGADRSIELAQAGTIGWEEATRKLRAERSSFPMAVKVDPSCATIPAAYDPSVQKAALETLRRSANDPAAGKAENGFFASEKIFGDGYSVGPIFKSGFQRRIDQELVKRMKPNGLESVGNGNYPPSLFVHGHPNNAPPSPPKRGDGLMATEIDVPVAAIDRAGNLFCVLPDRKKKDR